MKDEKMKFDEICDAFSRRERLHVAYKHAVTALKKSELNADEEHLFLKEVSMAAEGYLRIFLMDNDVDGQHYEEAVIQDLVRVTYKLNYRRYLQYVKNLEENCELYGELADFSLNEKDEIPLSTRLSIMIKKSPMDFQMLNDAELFSNPRKLDLLQNTVDEMELLFLQIQKARLFRAKSERNASRAIGEVVVKMVFSVLKFVGKLFH